MAFRRLWSAFLTGAVFAVLTACRSTDDPPPAVGQATQDRVTDLEARVSALEARLGEQESLLAELRTTVAARRDPPGVSGFPWDTPIRGRVCNVDLQMKLVVFDVGRRAGVKRGMLLDVIRGSTYIGRVRVDTAWDDSSSGIIMVAASGQTVQVGDVATNTLN